MKSEIIPGAGGTTGGAGGPPEYDPLDDSSGSDSEDSDSGPNSESLTGSDEFVRVRMSSMDGSMLESEARQDDSRNESGVRQGDERNTLTSEPGNGNPAAAGNVEDTGSGATASGVSHAALEQVTQKLGILGLESGKASSKVEEGFVDGNVRDFEVGKGLVERPSRLEVVKVSGGTSSVERAAASCGVSKVEARSEQSTGIKVHIHTIPSRPGITAFGVGQIPESSSRQSGSSNAYNPLADSSQSSSSSNSPDTCDHDEIAEFSALSKSSSEEDKTKSELNTSVVKEASLVSASQTLITSEYQTDPRPRPATTVYETVAASSIPGISARPENTSQCDTRILRLSQLKLQQDPLISASLVKTEGGSSPEVFSAQGLPQKNHPSYMSAAMDSGAEETPCGINPVGPEDLSNPTESCARDTERSKSTSSNECLNKSTSAAAPAVAHRTTRFRQKVKERGGILPLKIKLSPGPPSAVHEASSLTENTSTDASVSFESSATVEPTEIQPKDRVRKIYFSTPPAMPALEPTQQFKSEKKQAPVQNSAPVQPSRLFEAAALPPDPEQAIQIYTDGAKMHLKNLSIADIVDEDESGFKFYCKAWFEAIVCERQWHQINSTMIPSVTVEKVVASYECLRSYVMRVENIFGHCICLPLAQISQQVSLQHLKGLNQLFPDFKELVESQATHFAEQYEKRNKEIIQLEGQVIGALIEMCGKYFEEEAVHQMESNYFELEPLTVLLKGIEQGIRDHFLNVCSFKVATWENKYAKIFDEEIEQRTSNVKSINEKRSFKTRTDIKESIDKAVEKYSVELVEKLKKQTGALSKLRMTHRTVANSMKDEISNQIKLEFMRKWKSCPLLYENAVKDFEKRVTQIYEDESKKLLDQKSSPSYGHQGATSCGVMTRSQANSQLNHNSNSTQPGKTSSNQVANRSEDSSSMHGARLRGTTQQNPDVNPIRPEEKTVNALVKPPEDPLSMFKDLPFSTIAIHMGLSQTSMGLFRPGTKDVVNLGRVEHMLYYRDNTILVAYDDMAKQKLGEPDLDFRGLLVKGPIDELVEVNLGGQKLSVRKEQIFSSFLAALKWKAELETKMKLRDCVIVVPQFLNTDQRKCIGNAAEMAGFQDVKFIDDTTAIALEYMMEHKIYDGAVIAISALEGLIDIARFTMKNGVLRRNELSGPNFMKSARPKGVLSRALNVPWSFLPWTAAQEGNAIEKMFSLAEFDVGFRTIENDDKIFAGGEEVFSNVRSALRYAPLKSFIKKSELSILRGGAYMAEICKGNESCRIFKTWRSLNNGYGWRWKPSYEEFEKEMLSTTSKEKKRASNFPSGKDVTLSKEDIAQITEFLKDGVEVHDVAMKAIRVLKAIEEAAARKQIRKDTALDVLHNVVQAHLSELRQLNLRIDEAKRILDDMLDTWREYVLGHGTSTSSQK